MIQRTFIFRYCFILLGLTLASVARAAAPIWTWIPENYEQTMVMTGKIYIQEQVVRKTTCFIGAFVDGACRGSASLVYYPTLDAYIASLMIYGHNVDENKALIFKCYEQDADSIYSLNDTLKFSSNAIIGNYAVPFQWGLKIKTALPSSTVDAAPAFVCYSPSKGLVNVFLREPLMQDAIFSMHSMNGMLVYKELCVKGTSVVDITNIQAGYYILSVRGESIIKKMKVLVLK